MTAIRSIIEFWDYFASETVNQAGRNNVTEVLIWTDVRTYRESSFDIYVKYPFFAIGDKK